MMYHAYHIATMLDHYQSLPPTPAALAGLRYWANLAKLYPL